MKKMNWFKRFLAGLGIGIGAAIPGVSGAAIALIFRVYETIIDAVNNFRKEFKKSFKTLLPILIGIFIAVIGCIILFKLAFEHMMFLTICIFAGFLIGSLPSVFTKVEGEPIVKNNIIIAVSSGVIVIGLGVLSIILGNNGLSVGKYFYDADMNAALLTNWWMFFILFFVGIIASVALTIPGFSGSLILLILGFYKPLLNSAETWGKWIITGSAATEDIISFILMILIFGIGCIVGVVFVSKIMRKLLDKHQTPTYYAIIGFIIGSIPVLFLNYQIWEYYSVWGGATVSSIDPVLGQGVEITFGVIALAFCAFLSFMIVRMQNNIKNAPKKNLK